MLPFFGSTFLPDLREGHLILHVAAMPGTSLDKSLRIGKLINDALRKAPGVRSVAQHAGRAEAGPDTTGTHSSELGLAPTRLPFGGGELVQPPPAARVPATLKDQTVRMIAHASLGGGAGPRVAGERAREADAAAWAPRMSRCARTAPRSCPPPIAR